MKNLSLQNSFKGRLLCLILFTLLSVILIFSACKKEVKQDNNFPQLPAYSETGSNTGGVFIDGYVWLCRHPSVFKKTRSLEIYSYPRGDSLVLVLNGLYQDTSLYMEDFTIEPREIFFVIKGINVSGDTDLLKLDRSLFY